MFKRLFLLSGLIAFLLACALMYFWYLPNHSSENLASPEQEVSEEVLTTESDSLHTAMPLEFR
jgi:hypothetical protein